MVVAVVSVICCPEQRCVRKNPYRNLPPGLYLSNDTTWELREVKGAQGTLVRLLPQFTRVNRLTEKPKSILRMS